ncbi:MAG: glutamine--tRNA ligase, partial [Oscillospiraceae bacterium]
NSIVEIEMLEHSIRDELNFSAQRRIAVLDPLKVVITNYPEDKIEYFDISNNPQNPDSGTRKVPFSREIFVEQSDFMENPIPKFFRLKPDGEVRLMGAYVVKLNEIIKDENGNVIELHCTADLETGGKNPPDGRKIKGTIHWVSGKNCITADVMMYDKLFIIPNLNAMEDGKEYNDYLNPNSLIKLSNCKLEESLATAKEGEKFQFVRMGYFSKDTKNSNTFNSIVGLKDTWKK